MFSQSFEATEWKKEITRKKTRSKKVPKCGNIDAGRKKALH
jgi:hypothetical protein